MDIKKTKNAIMGTLTGVINKIVAMLLPFIVRTIVQYKLSVEYLGLSGLFTSILNILNLAELGFSTAVIFSMYKPIAEDDKDSINALLNFYKKIYKYVSIIVLVAGLCFLPILKFFITGGYPSETNIYFLYLIYLSNSVLGYAFFAYRASLLTAHQRNDVTNNVHTIIHILLCSLQIVVLLITANYYLYAIVLPITTFLYNLIIYFIVKKKYPEYEPKGEITQEQKGVIKKKVFALMIHRVGSTVQGSIDSIFISMFFGLTTLGIYNNYIYISTAIQGFVTIIFQSLTAGVGNYVHKNDVEENYKLFNNIFFLNAFVVAFCSICLFVLYQPFMELWSITSVGNSSLMLSSTVMISLVLLFYVNNIRATAGMYREAIGLWDQDKWRPLCISIFNLIFTAIFAYLNSLIGVILATICAYLFVSLYWETKVLFKNYFNKSTGKYFLKMLCYFSSCILIAVIVYYLCTLIVIAGIWGFVLKAIICCFATIGILLLTYCWLPEFKFYLNKIKGVLKRKNG